MVAENILLSLHVLSTLHFPDSITLLGMTQILMVLSYDNSKKHFCNLYEKSGDRSLYFSAKGIDYISSCLVLFQVKTKLQTVPSS